MADYGAPQASKNLPRVGILAPGVNDQSAVFAALRKGFADLGYIDGKPWCSSTASPKVTPRPCRNVRASW
jgi:hypothetical protein